MVPEPSISILRFTITALAKIACPLSGMLNLITMQPLERFVTVLTSPFSAKINATVASWLTPIMITAGLPVVVPKKLRKCHIDYR